MDTNLDRWRTKAYSRLYAPLSSVLGDRTAKEFAALRIQTVGDLLRHIPRRYLSGTELTDLATLVEGDHVAVMAKVSNIERHSARPSAGRKPAPGRLEVTLTDGMGRLTATFFGRDHLLDWWSRQLQAGVAGLFLSQSMPFAAAKALAVLAAFERGVYGK